LCHANPNAPHQFLREIIKQKPDYTPAYIRLGLLYKSTARPEQALEILQQAFEKAPNQPGIVKMMVDIYTAEKQYNQALDVVNGAIARANSDAKAFFENMKGEIYLKSKQPETALAHFTRAEQLNPEFITPRMHMAGLFNAKGQGEKALEEYRLVEKINPSYVPALIAMGFIFDLQKNFIQAEAYYRKVLEITPDHPNAANNLAFILSDQARTVDEAFKFAQIAREKAPKDPNVLDTMGWVYYQKGNYLNALSELEESLRLNPKSALACYHYGMALYKTQAYEKARSYFKLALEIDPNFKGATTAQKMLN
jgi:tetratricopeptide (TPR) repeat protein